MKSQHPMAMCIAVLICLASGSCAGCAREPDHRLFSPNRTYEARVFISAKEYDISVERVVIFKKGVRLQEMPGGNAPLDKTNSVLAITDDGSLYLGRHSGHLLLLHDVYVHRGGITAHLGKASSPSEMRAGLSGDARWWEQWESSRTPENPFELSFLREPGMINHGMLSPTSPGYDAALPGYRILGESNGYVQMVLRPTSEASPARLVLSLQAGRMETVVKPLSNVRHRTNLCVFSIRCGDMVIRNDLVRRGDSLAISKGPADYFRYDIIIDAVHVTFLPKALALLNKECRFVWAHSLDR